MNTFHLSPRGSDRKNQPAARPWKSLPFAIERIRELRAEKKISGPVTLKLAPGTYPLQDTLDLGPEDSHLTISSAQPGKALIEGGEIITGWKETTHQGIRAWIVDLPEVAQGRWYFRSLFVNNTRAPRARYPKFSPDRDGVSKCLRIHEIRFPEKRKLFDGDAWFKPKPEEFQNWPSLIDSEIVILHYWTEARLPQPVYDPATGWVRCSRRTAFNLYESWKPDLARYYVDNLAEALSDPGEWYLNRTTGRLTYLPRRGETLKNTTVIAPRVVRFIRARGLLYNEGPAPVDPHETRPIESLSLDGLSFQHGDWFQPVSKFLRHDRRGIEDIPLGASSQAAKDLPSAVEFAAARNCSISNCSISHVGVYGIDFTYGSRHCQATHNRLHDIGGGGIRIWGGDLDEHPVRFTGHIQVNNNSITRIGQVFHQAVGLLLGAVFDCEASHNLIKDTCYTGVSVGWSWGFRETISRNNRIENNRIHNIGMAVLSDMGGIYLLGVQPGTVIRGNHISKVESHHYGGWGIYPDEGSSHILIENNLVHDTQGSPLRIHFSRELVVRNNVLVGSREEGIVGIGRVENHVCATLLHNLLIGPSPKLYEGGYAGDLFQHAFATNSNLIWFEKGRVPVSGNPDYRKKDGFIVAMPFAQWQKLGFDTTSKVADPLFRNQAKQDFRLKPQSPAFKIGFRPVDWSKCGPRANTKD